MGPCNVNTWYTLRDKPATKKDIPTDVDAIYISHEHEDHFQAESLLNFNKNTQIFICNFPVANNQARALV